MIKGVRHGFEEIEIRTGREPASGGEQPLRFDREPAALDALSRISHGRGGMPPLRAVLARAVPSLDVSALVDHDVLHHLAALVVSGRLRLVTVPRRRVVALGHEEGEAKPAQPEGRKIRHWIAIRLVDADNRPVPNERYRIVGPGGSDVSGTLDANGYARVDDLDAGTAKVSFPDRDREDWRPAG